MTEQITHFGLRGDKVIPAPINAKRAFFVGNMQINHVARASLGLPWNASFISSGVLTGRSVPNAAGRVTMLRSQRRTPAGVVGRRMTDHITDVFIVGAGASGAAEGPDGQPYFGATMVKTVRRHYAE